MTKLDEVLARSVLDVDGGFRSGQLDRSLWFPHYLPQWSSRDRSAARYEFVDGRLHLLIAPDQGPWCPEFDGPTRVSSLQTGVFSGPEGSTVGQHRFTPAAVVREPQEMLRLSTPQFGVFVLRAAALDDPDCMVALWMIGFEDRPERSAEICICEIFGSEVAPGSTKVGMGVHPFGDPTIRDEFEKVELPIDAREMHEYAAEWTPERVTFFVDGEDVKVVEQSPRYPMQCMLGIYDFGAPTPATATAPKRFVVDTFEVYRPR